MRWARPVALMKEKRNAYRTLVRKPEGKRLVEIPRRRWVDNILSVLALVSAVILGSESRGIPDHSLLSQI
jgi:hypothetical protein